MTHSSDDGDPAPPKGRLHAVGWTLALLLVAVAAFGLYRVISRSTGALRAQETSVHENATFFNVQGSRFTVPEGSPLRAKLEIAPVVEQDIQRSLTLPAVVEADPARTVKVLPPVTGRVLELKVELGSRVEQGDVLAIIEFQRSRAGPFGRRKGASRPQADQAERSIACSFWKKLRPSPSRIASRRRAIMLRPSPSTSRTQARLHAIGVSADQKSDTRLLPLKAPVAGSIIDLQIGPGSFLNDLTAPVMTIADLSDRLGHRATSPRRTPRWSLKGQSVDVVFTAYPDEVFKGQVLFVSDVLDPDTRRTKVRIAFANPDLRLKPNMFANATFLAPPAERAGGADEGAGSAQRIRSGVRRGRTVGVRSRAASRSHSSKAIRRSWRAASRPATASSSRAECCSMIDAIFAFALRKHMVRGDDLPCSARSTGIIRGPNSPSRPIRTSPTRSAQVVTQAPGMAAEEVEQRITIPLERELNGTPGLLFMRSKSTFGLSLITMVFRDGIEDYWSRHAHQRAHPERRPAARPHARPRSAVARRPARSIITRSNPTPRACASFPRYSAGSSFRRSSRCRASPTSATSAASRRSSSSSSIRNSSCASTCRSPMSRPPSTPTAPAPAAASSPAARLGYVVRGIGLVQTLDDMGAIVVTQRNGTPILLRDLGKLKLANQERHGILGKNQKNDAIEGTVLLAARRQPFAGDRGHPRQGRGAQRAAEGRRRSDRALYRPRRPRGCDDRQVSRDHFPGHRPGLRRPHPISRQPAQRADHRHHHSVRDGHGIHPDESLQDSRPTCSHSAPSISASSSTAPS